MKSFVLTALTCMLITTSAFAATEVANEDTVMAPGEIKSFSFTTTGLTPLQVDASGLKNTDKGFDVQVCPSNDFEACSGQSRGGQCRPVGEFNGLGVRSFSHTGTLPAGRWTLFVKNSYNTFFRATVRVHAVVGQ